MMKQKGTKPPVADQDIDKIWKCQAWKMQIRRKWRAGRMHCYYNASTL